MTQNLNENGISPITDKELLQMARDAMAQSYSPYSNYTVGAALLCDDGTVYTGCNVENGSYGLTICAERTAAVKAVSEGHREFIAIAISAKGNPPYPCGACQQFLHEFSPTMRVLVTWDGNEQQSTLDKLLTKDFSPM